MPVGGDLRRQKLEAWVLFGIMVLATYLRLHRLGYQSLWLDELYTMRECDPDVSWSACYHMVMAYENKSPLYFLFMKGVFTLFGHSAYMARLVSAVGGVWGVYVMYLLGKEAVAKGAGLMCALICAVNYFHIFYSQEARGYIFLFLFSALSWVYFLRLIKSPQLRAGLLYGLCAMLAIHFHPFALLVLLSQGLAGLIVCVKRQKSERWRLIKYSSAGVLVIVSGLLPVLVSLAGLSGQSAGWIPMPEPGFIVDYYYKYFYDSEYLEPFLWALPVLFVVLALTKPATEASAFDRRFIAALVFMWLAIAFYIPYLRSILVAPVLVIRYTIIALPAILLMFGLATWWLHKSWMRGTVLGGFIIISVLQLFVFKHFYHSISKAQFKKLAEYIKAEDPAGAPVADGRTAWQMAYYFKHLQMKNSLINKNLESFADSVISASREGKEARPFWLEGTYDDRKLSRKKQQALDSLYRMVRRADFHEAWAQYYEPGNSANRGGN